MLNAPIIKLVFTTVKVLHSECTRKEDMVLYFLKRPQANSDHNFIRRLARVHYTAWFIAGLWILNEP